MALLLPVECWQCFTSKRYRCSEWLKCIWLLLNFMDELQLMWWDFRNWFVVVFNFKMLQHPEK